MATNKGENYYYIQAASACFEKDGKRYITGEQRIDLLTDKDLQTAIDVRVQENIIHPISAFRPRVTKELKELQQEQLKRKKIAQ